MKRAFGFALASVVCGAQAPYDSNRPLRPEDVLLARIRNVMSTNLAGLPNYTCTLTIERSSRLARSKRYQTQDTVRFEVALVGGKELYAWPGSSQFDERELTDMVHGGSIGSGDFALHARSVFLSNTASFSYAGKDLLDGKPVHKFRYEIPSNWSGYRLRVPPEQGLVGYRGLVWNDADTLDLLCLEIDVHQIPPNLPVQRVSNIIEYQKVAIGAGAFLLPKSSELTLVDLAGLENKNRTTFSSCRQYSGESVLTFDDPPDTTPAASAVPAVTVSLPEGLDLQVKLAKLASQGRTAVGDPFELEVTKAVRRKDVEWIPKGARIQGRVTFFGRMPSGDSYFLIGLKPERFQAPNKTGAVSAALESPAITYFLPPGSRARAANLRYPEGLQKNTGYFVVSDEKFVLPSGFPMVWRTLDASGVSRP